MSSIIHLDKPCPCGSGKTYRDCCAPRGDARTPQPGQSAPDAAFLQAFEQFILDFSDAVNASNGYMIEAYGEATLGRAFTRLEVYPDTDTIDPRRGILVQTWDLFRLYTMEADYDRTVEYVRHEAGHRTAAVFDMMKDAELAAWQLETGDRKHRATAIDGREQPRTFSPTAITDTAWDDITGDCIVAAWSIELDAGPTLFFGVELSDQAVEKLEQLADRKAWGDGDDFRLHDYEEDVLALLVDPNSVLADENCGRLVLSRGFSIVEDALAQQLPLQLRDSLYLFGFDPNETPQRIVDSWKTHRFYFSGSVEEPSNAWARDAARAGDLAPSETARICRYLREIAVQRCDIPLLAIGAKTALHIVDDDQLLAMLHLTPTAQVDHPSAHRWAQYRLAVLDVEPSLLRSARLDPQWTIEQGLSWAERNVDQVSLRHLQEAAARHRLAMRFVGLVNLNDEHPDPPLGDISYTDLMGGIEQFFPSWAAETPIGDLDDTGRGTWTRLTRSFRRMDELADHNPLRIQDLPEQLFAVAEYPGVGEATIIGLWEGVFRYVKNWPDVAGYRPVAADDSTRRQASQTLTTGLDELDDLF